MRSSIHWFVLVGLAAALCLATNASAVVAASAGPSAMVTDHVYVRHDGGTDPAIQACGSDATTPGPSGDDGGNRQQNEPTVAINPTNPNLIVAGANDYCTVATFGDAWMGFYVSTDAGATWKNSLNPGYPTDTSAAGMASPVFQRGFASGDPVMGWDREGRLFYGGIAFDRSELNAAGTAILHVNGDVIVSTWQVDASKPLGMAYLRTVIVLPGTPSANFFGLFNDKPSLKVDAWPASPHQGNVYFAWTLFNGAGQDKIVFSRSTDHGVTFSAPSVISKGVANAQGTDIAVAPDGTVYVAWRQFAFPASGVGNAIVFVKSTDGGATFSAPRRISSLVPYDRRDVYVSGGGARDCGSLSDACVSGYTFHRADLDAPAIAVDGNNKLYVVWSHVFNLHSTGTTYRPGGQAQIVMSTSTNGGQTWTAPTKVDGQPSGHQFWADVAATESKVFVIYYDSRNDPAYSEDRPPGNSATGTSSGPSLDVYASISSDGGASWSHTRVSDVSHQPNFEMFGNRQVPFHGDYIWVDAVGDSGFAVWTDNRNVVPGDDPREITPGGPGTTPLPADGFDVLQCRAWATSTMTWGPDTCANAGGLNQNIYGAALS